MADPNMKEIYDVVSRHAPVGNRIDMGLSVIDIAGGSFVLVEKNVGAAQATQSHYFSRHESPSDAAAYWEGQEYREDWDPIELVDLTTGESFEPRLTLKFGEVRS